MPLFFVVSGMVWNRESHAIRGYFTKTFLIDKFKRLIVPCCIWGVLYLVLGAIIDKSFSPISIAYLIYGSQSGFSHAGSLTSLWFLPCMFLSVCMFEILQKMLKNLNKRSFLLFVLSIISAVIGIFLPRISGGYPWSIDVSFMALAFMIWGHLGRVIVERIGKQKVFTILLALASFVILTVSYSFNLSNISINNVDMAGRYFGDPLLFLIDALAGCLFVLLISELISGLCGRGLVELGKKTIPIFIIHKPIVQVLNKFGLALSISEFAIVVASVGIAIFISLIIYKALHIFIPFVFGEKKLK